MKCPPDHKWRATATVLAPEDRVNNFELRQSFTGKRSSVAPQGAATNVARLRDEGSSFQKVVLPHLDDAYGLAHWLIDDRTESESVVQGACLSAFRGIGENYGSNARVWILSIVHRAVYEWLGKNQPTVLATVEDSNDAEYARHDEFDAEAPQLAVLGTSATQLEAAIAALPAPIRETIVLRDILGLSYRDIAEVTGATTSAIMLQLAEARHTLLVNVARNAPDSGGARQTRYDQQLNVIA
jgi:RNA polymerase sigma factor (sigma-70 family)